MINKYKEIYLAGGCFWGIQIYLEKNPHGYCHISRKQIENVKNM